MNKLEIELRRTTLLNELDRLKKQEQAIIAVYDPYYQYSEDGRIYHKHQQLEKRLSLLARREKEIAAVLVQLEEQN